MRGNPLLHSRKMGLLGSGLCYLATLVLCTEISGDADRVPGTGGLTPDQRPQKEILPDSQAAPTARGEFEPVYRGRYNNYDYGYSIRIPLGLRGTGSSPPNPNHGIRIILSASEDAFIWTDGSYNAASYASLEQAANAKVS